MTSWVIIFFVKGLMVSLTEVVGMTPPPASNPSQPLNFAEMEVVKQHLMANGRWLLGLGKEELRLLSRLTGSDIGGDLLAETSHLDYIMPDFGSPPNPYQHVYPGSASDDTSSSISQTNQNDTIDTSSTSLISNSSDLYLTRPTFSPDIPSSIISGENTEDSSNYTYNLTAPFSPSISDPSDDDIVFKPLPAAGETPNTPSLTSNNSNSLQTSENLNASLSNASQSVTNETTITSSGNQSSELTTQKPTVDPLIYPVQFYNESSLPQSNPSSEPSSLENFNPLANLAEKYSDNFMGW